MSCVHRFGAWHRLMSHVPKVAVCREGLWGAALQVSPAFGRRNKYIYCRCWPPGKFRHASGRRNKKYLLSLPVKNSRGATNINTLYTYIHIVYTYKNFSVGYCPLWECCVRFFVFCFAQSASLGSHLGWFHLWILFSQHQQEKN